jgi:hypothetical protein
VRPAGALAALGLALAVGVPAAWTLTRPASAAGAPVGQVLAAPAPPSAPPSPAARPAAGAHDAAPTAGPAVTPPARLTVAALGVDAAVDAVGVAPDGQLALPEDVDRIGWYRFGPAPGTAGNAVLAGHVDGAEQGLGALAPLREAAVGSEVVVTDAAGTASHWRVVSREQISKRALPLDAIFGRDGPPRLVLVTCGGPFLRQYGSYADNVVVVSEPLP